MPKPLSYFLVKCGFIVIISITLLGCRSFVKSSNTLKLDAQNNNIDSCTVRALSILEEQCSYRFSTSHILELIPKHKKFTPTLRSEHYWEPAIKKDKSELTQLYETDFKIKAQNLRP